MTTSIGKLTREVTAAVTTNPRGEEGSAADEGLITGAKILAALAFVAFIATKAIPFLEAMDLSRVPLLP